MKPHEGADKAEVVGAKHDDHRQTPRTTDGTLAKNGV
jgi:hypothetical protein